MASKYIIPKGTKCIAYRRNYDTFERPFVEKKSHVLQQDNKFDQAVLTPQHYFAEPSLYPGNTYTVQLVLQGYMVFKGKARTGYGYFFLAAPEDQVKIQNQD